MKANEEFNLNQIRVLVIQFNAATEETPMVGMPISSRKERIRIFSVWIYFYTCWPPLIEISAPVI